MRAGRIILLVVGCLLALPALAMLAGGVLFTAAYATQRTDDGYFETGIDRLRSDTAAVASDDIDLNVEQGTPRWVIDALETDIQLRVTSTDGDRPVFVGIAPEADLDAYLSTVAHDEVRTIENREAELELRAGGTAAEPPTEQDFWEASASGLGTQQLDWTATSGEWAVVVMNADGQPEVAADVDIGVRSDAFLPAALTLLGLGAIGTLAGVALIIVGARSHTTDRPATAVGTAAAEPGAVAPSPLAASAPSPHHPLTIEARLDPELSTWQWLVKWLLAIPHLIVLWFLFIAFTVLTVVAGFAILFTGRYPRSIFDFNVGVLRWGWRVAFYAYNGGLGTDRYPPFSLDDEPDYPATLDVEYPEELSRGLVLVKWWLLAIPHYIIVAVIAGGGISWWFDDWSTVVSPGGGLVGILCLVAGVMLLVTGAYPRQLFDLIIGMNRWVYRVVAYVALMTDVYPPFRLDQGGPEPTRPPGGSPSGYPGDSAADPVAPTTSDPVYVQPPAPEPTPLR